MSFRKLFLLLFLAMANNIYAQPWYEAAKKTDGSVNFFDVQRQFELYWNGKTREKGKGIKPYRRWEYFWSSRVDSRGNFPPPNINNVEWEKYIRVTGKRNNGSRAGAWTSLGPTSSSGGYAGTGRISAIAFHPTDANAIFVGTPGGGLWKSSNGGDSWAALTDHILAHLGISGIVIHPTNPSTMYIATGDADGYDTYSIGVMKSLDGGITWNPTGLSWALTGLAML